MKTRQQFLGLLVLALGMVVAAVPARAQVGTLEGIVKDQDGQPMAGITVEFDRTDIHGVYTVTTDKDGHYVHAGLPAGSQARYTVRILKNGVQLYQLTNVSVPIGDIRTMDIDLQKEKSMQQQSMSEAQKKQMEEMKKKIESGKELQAHFDQGIALMQQKQYDQAITEFQAAEEIDPKQPAVWANLGQAYGGANQPDKGIEAYQKAIELEQDPQQLAGLYNNMGQLYIKLDRPDDAKAAFEKAASVNPADAGVYYFNLGVTFYNHNDCKSAVDPLKKATEADPQRADAWYWLGVCLYSTAETKVEGGKVKTVLQPGTEESFEKYLELAPNGSHAEETKQYLQIIEATVPASVRVKKKKGN